MVWTVLSSRNSIHISTCSTLIDNLFTICTEQCMCSVQSENLHNLEIALHNLTITHYSCTCAIHLRYLEIAQLYIVHYLLPPAEHINNIGAIICQVNHSEWFPLVTSVPIGCNAKRASSLTTSSCQPTLSGMIDMNNQWTTSPGIRPFQLVFLFLVLCPHQ